MIVVGILNYKRPIEVVENLVNSVNNQEIDDKYKIVLCTDKSDEERSNISKYDNIDNSELNVPESKNAIIKYARKKKAKKVIIIEDDVTINDDEKGTFKRYINTMNDLKVGILFCCYTKTSNFVLTKPSPRILMGYKGLGGAKTDMVSTNRYEVGDFILINLETNELLFNEGLSHFELSEYVFRCWQNDLIPALNQFYDIPDSWEYLGANPGLDSMRNYDEEHLAKEKELVDSIIGDKWKINNNAEDVVNHIRTSLGV